MVMNMRTKPSYMVTIIRTKPHYVKHHYPCFVDCKSKALGHLENCLIKASSKVP